MNFSFSIEEEHFTQQMQSFFLEEKETADKAKQEYESGLGFGPNCWKILQKIGERGWICPTWPLKYGGLELSFIYKYISKEQLHYYTGIPGLVGAGMAGPIILSHGTEKQKDYYLLPIAKGEVEYTLGYTEPDAGSDLAALMMDAEDKGNHFPR